MRPLSGVRTVTFERFAAGPYGSMLLANLGAEVIKVENRAAGGDLSRFAAPDKVGDADSTCFEYFNLGKRSVALDLAQASDRARFERLVATSIGPQRACGSLRRPRGFYSS